MAVAPPNPTPAEIRQNRQWAGGRISIVWDELKHILLEVLPAGIELVNAEEAKRYPVPRHCHIAPEKLDGDFPAWVIMTPDYGMQDFTPGTSEAGGNTRLLLAYNQMMSPYDIKNSHDLLELVVATLYPMRGGRHRDGLQIWNGFSPAKRVFVSGIPNWNNVRGVAQDFNFTQFPGEERWVKS